MKRIAIFVFSLLLCASAGAQTLLPGKAKYTAGNAPEWASPTFDDSSWQEVGLPCRWGNILNAEGRGYCWFRIHLTIPASLRRQAVYGRQELLFRLGCVDDCDETYLNGKLIGKEGRMPSDGEYASAYSVERVYPVAFSDPAIRWDGDNVIAVKVYDDGGIGGFRSGEVSVSVHQLPDFVDFAEETVRKADGSYACAVSLESGIRTSGVFRVRAFDPVTGETLGGARSRVKASAGKSPILEVTYDIRRRTAVEATFEESKGGRVSRVMYADYILTPPAPESPRYNGPAVYGVRPGSPLIFRMPFSGKKPMKYSVEGLPEGIVLDGDEGVLGGSASVPGDYVLTLRASNSAGEASARLTLKVGSRIALTPPMGWNSWNVWGTTVSQEKVVSSARAIIEKGLADYGYSYINVDDAWESSVRNPDGTISTNEKFPDMKGLGDWLHLHGLKLGIYSSPGDRTCGNYLGSIGHERQDAEVWNSWGVDYLKYDWCGYEREFRAHGDKSLAAHIRPYMLMQQYLRDQPRDIFYSLCQYGRAEVWKWGALVDANSWRTTGDIFDNWESMSNIGFVRQAGLSPYSGPGRWNDPDMLVVGKLGWSDKLHRSGLTVDEQYTHISLWSLLAANMLIGCDVAQIDDFTIGLLCNNEVNAVGQDELGRQADRILTDGGIQVWSRPLSDGGVAVGIFNLGGTDAALCPASLLSKAGIPLEGKRLRDLWRQEYLSDGGMQERIVPWHGVLLLKVK